jgi:endonuclease YncB( thermonuclease family)
MRAAMLAVTVLTTVGTACADRAPTAAPGAATVTHVVDGDTIDVQIGGRDERVRLIGIDTPETKKPNTPVECYGPEATAFTASLLPVGTAVLIERDIVGRDDYGRLLGYVYLTTDRGAPTTFVNVEIVRRGYATPLAIEPNTTFASAFVDAARTAEDAGLGLWSACSP